MPSKQPSGPQENQATNAGSPDSGNTFRQLVAFLELTSGFKLAFARCNSQALCRRVIDSVTQEASKAGIKVFDIDVGKNFTGDFAASVRQGIPADALDQNIALMIRGIDELIYKDGRSTKDVSNIPFDQIKRTPFVAQLNFDRERLAQELPYPLVIWLEDESYRLLFKEAPDLTRWVWASFNFDETAPSGEVQEPSIMEGRRKEEISAPAGAQSPTFDISSLLKELDATPESGGSHDAAKRLSLLTTLFENLLSQFDYRRAERFGKEALSLSKRLKDRRSEGNALGNLGIAYANLGETRRAIEFYEQVLAIDREIGDRRGEGADLGNLGSAYDDLGEYRRAIQFHEHALVIDREIGDRRGEGQDLGNLGVAYKNLGEYRRAIEFYEQHLAIAREIGDRRGEGNALGNLGVAYKNLGETRRAIEYYEQALVIEREIGDRRGEGHALGNLGVAYRSLGEYRRAIEYYEQALVIQREIGDRPGEGNALFNMSLALDQLGDRKRAIEHAEAALKIKEQIEGPTAGKVRSQLEQWKKL